jgi:16S rRNA (adenine1518-N6/adenine1519-N6)-dimethyltransferase
MVKLSQNFLIDRNMLGVIERLAALSGDDVVLEIGGGMGILSERLAAGARHVHVVEIDRGLEDDLRAALEPYANFTLHLEDALELDLKSLDPAPTKVIANLPYAIAATVIVRTIEDLDTAENWVVMVQREVGERLAASPGTPAYGAPSVLVQLAADVSVLRRVSRTVFRPVPNVDSVLLGLRRHGAAADPALRRLVHGAFAHRRKTLAGSLALAADSAKPTREQVRAALEHLGHAPDARAERLSPEEFRDLAKLLSR